MTHYPHELGEAERFVPSAFADMKNPPTLWLRWGSPREKRAFRKMIDLAGLRTYDQAQHRAELITGMEKLLGDDFAAWEPRVRAYWDATDSYAEEIAQARRDDPDVKEEDLPKFAFDGEAEVVLTIEQVAKDWHPYRRMVADSRETGRETPGFISAVIVERYENLHTPPERDEDLRKYLSRDCIADLCDEMDALARKNGAGAELKPSSDLHAQTMIRLFMPKDWEKKLRIAVAIRSDPTRFEAWEGIEGWEVEGVGYFDRNPRELIGDAEYELVGLYRRCDQGMAGFRYPDGRAELDQPCVLLEAFGVIGSAFREVEKTK